MKNKENKEVNSLLELSDLWRRYDRVYTCWTQKHGISNNAMTLIEELYMRPEGVEPAEAADHLGIPRQTMTATLDALERKSIIGRFPHEKDRRRKVIRFTPEGWVLAEKLVKDLHEWEIKALSSLSKTELARAYKTVKLFCTELEKGLRE
ncbi:MAG: MarR family transcriptional regulator [Synergistaceae bacterium]|nr:MarR family transcriptional regulator [Synergistaceae bacterium]